MRVKPARILCATDFSPASNHALPYAVGFARKFQARLFVCHAVDISSLELSSAAEFVLPYTREELTQRAEREIQRHMAGAGVDWEPVLLQGEPATEVAGAAERLGVDLVVLATHGRSGLQRLIVGSVTERLLRVLRCPVLAVHAPERELVAPGTYELRLRRILVGCDFSSDSSRALEHAISLAQELQAEIHLVHVLEPSLHLHLSATTKALATELERAVD
ncbi:MAG: universal stress protein, partial [Planctomycetes bacterium]|nr:universal stress protein [Planctomycetota bacterium]